MSWQQPTGNVNPNAPSFTPGNFNPNQQGGAYYPQQGGYNGNNSQYGQQWSYNPQQQQQGGYNSNYPPQQGTGGYQDPYNNNTYQPQQQGGGGGGYYPRGGYGGQQQQQQRGGNRGGSNYPQQQPQQQQGGYNYNNNAYVPQNMQQRYQQNEGYQQQVQPQNTAQPQPASPASPTAATSDAARLSLGGGATQPVVLPKKKGGGTLSLGKKKQEVAKAAGDAATPQPGANTPTTTTAATAKESGESPVAPASESGPASPSSPTTTAADEQPTNASSPAPDSATSKSASPAPAKETEKDRSKMTPEELREAVKKEIARLRSCSKKTYKRDPRPHYNIVFCGHVDAGKSTISGHLLMEKGLVDSREMDKLRREAEIHHREGWEYAYVMDVSEDERAKGITRETGAAYFETEKRRVTVLDAPGHKAFVPSMIGGATQADICVLVISSRTGEFETGFEKGGQTREHAMLVRTCGVKQMICVVNKMDEMKWSKERYDEIVGKLRPFLRQNGYSEEGAKNLLFIPVAGLTGENLIKHVDAAHCDWYKGQTMMEVIDELMLPESKTEDDVLCIPLVGAYKDDGKTYIYGKVESGSIAVGEKIQVLPAKQEAVVEGISIESTEFEKCYPGDNVHLRVRGIDENDIHGGYVATSIPTSLRAVEFFQARVVILDVRNIISAGSRVMLHIHAAQEEASFHKLFAKVDRKTNEIVEKDPACVKAGDIVIARIELDRPVVMEVHKDFDKLGRFMLRDDGKTIAIGVVTKLYESTHESLAKTGK
ncbi:putative eukaryotic release factor 3 [Leptomonas pyrrhocoris]|uniref:Putative eukaryotic release factor 3 n=1 Tax=Leptomonas pyrrhocoris TaxID=157538 RepID=A0A0M9FVX9_LEPPY|nr:putative eukaryotic release factor 3 [Leptomonas pyrrhocoris]KPA77093.1 putative eukaryotic release factor 3 [Leptomonas pyrrhocoris]|eukprot:XP_015655532.1 putative eukaryotic release factor 3 [Leptomonas pyrrhocoris]